MFKWKYGRFMPFYAPDSGADGGAGASGEEGEIATPPEIDYKAKVLEWEAKYKKLIKDFDDTSTELASKKKAEKARMTEEEQREAENAEKEQRYQEMAAKLAEMQTANLFAKNGFDEKDYGDIAAKIVEVGSDKASELAESIIAFVKKSNQSAVANAQRGGLKDGAHYPQTSTSKPSDTPFAEQAIAYTKHDDKSQEIKNKYR